MPTLRAAIAPNTSPTATATRIAAIVASQGVHSAGDPPSAATISAPTTAGHGPQLAALPPSATTRFAYAMPAMP